MDKLIFSKYSNERDEVYKIRTDIYEASTGQRTVVKSAASEQSKEHIVKMYKTYEELKKQFANTIFEPNEGKLHGDSIILEYVYGDTLCKILNQCLERNNIQYFKEVVNKYVDSIKSVAKKNFVPSYQYFEVFGMSADADLKEKTMLINNIDMIFDNIIWVQDKWIILDYEWTYSFGIPLGFILFRAAFYYDYYNNELLKESGIDIYELMGIEKGKIDNYKMMEQQFQKYLLKGHVTIPQLYEKQRKQIRFPVIEAREEEESKKIQVFKDFGHGFESTQFVDYELKESGKIFLEFDVEKGLKILRLDPAQTSCIVSLEEVTGVFVSGEECQLPFTANGKLYGEKIVFFDDLDPQIWINIFADKLCRIRFCMYIGYTDDILGKIMSSLLEEMEATEKKLKDVTFSLSKITDEYETMIRAYEQKDCVLEQILNSKRWKLTHII